jgi:tetratricopeptide (TPR) repeat protein
MTIISLDAIKTMIRQRQADAAERALVDIHRAQRGTPESYYLLGSLLSQKNRIAEAVEAFQSALRLDPRFVDAAISLSVVFNDIGDYKEGRRYFQLAEQLARATNKFQGAGVLQTKEISRGHLDLAQRYRGLQAWDDAISEYVKAAQLDPKNPEIRILLSKAYAQKRMFREAHAELHRLVTENPGHISARVHLALLYHALGNTIDAQIELNEALKHDPHNEQVKTYLAMTREASESTINN